jgi:hypothetical protein
MLVISMSYTYARKHLFNTHLTITVGGNFLWTSKNADAAKLLQHKPSNFVIAVGLKSRQPFQADQYTQFLKVS